MELGEQILLLWQKQWTFCPLASKLLLHQLKDLPLSPTHEERRILKSLQLEADNTPSSVSQKLFLREGPRPFPLHIGNVVAMFSSFAQAILDSDDAYIQEALQHISPSQLLDEMNRAVLKKSSAFVRGLIAYHEHPYVRPNTEAGIVWQRGSTSLKEITPIQSKEQGVIFMIPSLVNRSYILDLMPEYSLCDYLRNCGYRIFLLDWGSPKEEESSFSMQDYFLQRLLPAVEWVRSQTTAPLFGFGYCMGGIFLRALCNHIPLIGAIYLATPWDFEGHVWRQWTLAPDGIEALGPFLSQDKYVPGDVLQVLFHSLNPLGILDKFERFSQWTDDRKRILFVAIEDWANDCVPLTKGVAHELLTLWLKENGLAQGTWGISQSPFEMTPTHPCHSLVIWGERDRIVPPACAAPLLKILPMATAHSFPVGHAGLVVSNTAGEHIWPALNSWLKRTL